MAYRNPRFYFHHAMRTAGIAALGGSAINASYPLARAIDSCISQNTKFSGTSANQFVKVDRGAGYASLPQPDRLIIPAGHNLTGATVRVRHHTSDPANGTSGTQIGADLIVAAGLNVHALSTAMSNRYGLVNVIDSGTAWEFGELWLSVLRTTTRGPDPKWRDGSIPNVERAELSGGQSYRRRRGADRRFFDFLYHGVDGADLQVFRDLRTETQNGALPFYMDPPDDTEGPALYEILDFPPFEQDTEVPGVAGLAYEIRLTVQEQLS